MLVTLSLAQQWEYFFPYTGIFLKRRMPLLFVVAQHPASPFLEASTVPPMSVSEALLADFLISPQMPSGSVVFDVERADLHCNRARDKTEHIHHFQHRETFTNTVAVKD